jgi:hypothetical protein
VLYGTSIISPGVHSDVCRNFENGNENSEDHNMNLASRMIASLLFTAALAAPVAIVAAPGPQVGVNVRVYDKGHKDYHNWDDNENRAWGVFLTTNHRKNHDFSKANKKEQSQYWNWRHSHPD